MKQKVLYIITKSDVGGAQKYAADLMANLDKNRFKPKILYGDKDLRWLSNKIWPFFINDWLAIFELIKIYKKERPHVIHLNSSKAGVLGSIAAYLFNRTNWTNKSNRAYAKVIFTAHGWVFSPTNALSLPIRWFYILLHKIAARFQNKIICVSEYDYNLALNYHIAQKDKLAMIHNGIDPNIKFLDKETAKSEVIKKLKAQSSKLKANVPWIGSVGRLVKEKNYETLIQTATLVPNAYFFIIGTGPEYAQLKAKSSKLKANVFFINPTGNDAKYLKAFDIFVMSSVKEGLPYILLEAMAAELPIVVTEAGGMPEVIQNHENGLMVTPKNPALLATAINGLLENQGVAKEIRRAAKQAVLEKFRLEEMVSKISLIYSDLSA